MSEYKKAVAGRAVAFFGTTAALSLIGRLFGVKVGDPNLVGALLLAVGIVASVWVIRELFRLDARRDRGELG